MLPPRVIKPRAPSMAAELFDAEYLGRGRPELNLRKKTHLFYEIGADDRVLQWEIKLEELKSSMLMEPSVFRELAE